MIFCNYYFQLTEHVGEVGAEVVGQGGREGGQVGARVTSLQQRKYQVHSKFSEQGEENMSKVIKEECWPRSICRWKKVFQIWLCVDKYFQICLVFCEKSEQKQMADIYFSQVASHYEVCSMLLILLLAEFYPLQIPHTRLNKVE